MITSPANARDAASYSTHKFPWKWNLADLPNPDGYSVFSCFSCGGGSSMGYKLAGFNVIGNLEIDPKINEMYRKNHHPKHSYTMDIRDFLRIPDTDIPPELYNLDILDGSPPCSVFSTVGKREEAWGVERKFREGQKSQRLDDLFFYFVSVADRLRPKVVIAENVPGLVQGNAKGYVTEILSRFNAAGYSVQMFLLDSSTMGVPQRRKRCFFLARRNDLGLPPISLSFAEPPICFGEVKTPSGLPPSETAAALVRNLQNGESKLSIANRRLYGKTCRFSHFAFADDVVANTITSAGEFYRKADVTRCSPGDFIAMQTFPQDYDFCGNSVQYVCGMSVPPVMMAQIASEVKRQWFGILGTEDSA